MPSGQRPGRPHNVYRDTLQPMFVLGGRPLIDWLRNRGLISAEVACRTNGCGRDMALVRRRGAYIDGYAWYCSRCRVERGIRHGSFFNLFKRIPLGTFMELIYHWVQGPLRPRAIQRLGLTSASTATKFSNVLTELCGEILIREPIERIGGVVAPNGRNTVQADESLFRRRKPHRGPQGRAIVQRWVFGMISLEFNPPRPIMHIVQDRSGATLVPIIQHHCLPGSTIDTDEWGGYVNLGNFGFRHRTVNHSRHFVDPVTGVHTNGIENAWKWAKAYLKQFRITSDAKLHAHLQAYMWRMWKGRPSPLPYGAFDRMLEDISITYGV